ncbi:phage tail protein [Rhodanobacter sp. Si-c]|uniref:Phage tail protein n=1 Tax=Rhodanobacter lycopersici TaxID=3162487 RepID=A0ABV3QGP6_9GAMM
MSDSFTGEIQVYGFNFAPINWAQCSGALLPISQYTALFSLIGVVYGGNGTSNFQLPNLVGSAACSQGQGPGLSPRNLGEVFGENQVTLLSGQMPAHNHVFNSWNQPDATKRSNRPTNGSALVEPSQLQPFPRPGAAPNTTFSPSMATGYGQAGPLPHENRQPALAINFCICLNGIFPTSG